MRAVNLKEKNIKHISHNDLDGQACHILTKCVVPRDDGFLREYIDINPPELHDEIMKTLNEINKYDLVIITDLSFNKELMELIEQAGHQDKFIVVDHHKSDLMNPNTKEFRNDWIIIQETEEVKHTDSYMKTTHIKRQTCATKLFWQYLCDVEPIMSRIGFLTAFAEMVRVYDTYEFTRDNPLKFSDTDFFKDSAPKLNMLRNILGEDQFEDYILLMVGLGSGINKIFIGNEIVRDVGFLIENEERRVGDYIEEKIKDVQIFDTTGVMGELKLGVIFTDRETSAIGHRILEKNPEVDLCILIDSKKISLRSRKTEVDSSEIAKLYGGGGHTQAAGFNISEDLLLQLTKELCNSMLKGISK